ncbi:hypothetical protein CaCOL14_013158 [Colletotrichum acutatum]
MAPEPIATLGLTSCQSRTGLCLIHHHHLHLLTDVERVTHQAGFQQVTSSLEKFRINQWVSEHPQNPHRQEPQVSENPEPLRQDVKVCQTSKPLKNNKQDSAQSVLPLLNRIARQSVHQMRELVASLLRHAPGQILDGFIINPLYGHKRDENLGSPRWLLREVERESVLLPVNDHNRPQVLYRCHYYFQSPQFYESLDKDLTAYLVKGHVVLSYIQWLRKLKTVQPVAAIKVPMQPTILGCAVEVIAAAATFSQSFTWQQVPMQPNNLDYDVEVVAVAATEFITAAAMFSQS